MLYRISVAERGLTGITNIFRSRLSRLDDLLPAGTVPLSELTSSCILQSLRACQRHIEDPNSLKLAVCNTDIGIYDLYISDFVYLPVTSGHVIFMTSPFTVRWILEGVEGSKTNEAYHSKADALLIPEMYFFYLPTPFFGNVGFIKFGTFSALLVLPVMIREEYG